MLMVISKKKYHFVADMERKLFLKKVGKRIVEIRTQKGLSQAELARLCDKDPQALERVENGKINPTSYTLHLVALALGVSTKDLLNFPE